MRNFIDGSVLFALLSLGVAACTVEGTGVFGDAVVLDERCAEDADCPTGFECETESESGADTSYCVSYDGGPNGDGGCPPGYELELEHGQSYCKPHGGDDGGSSSGGGGDVTSGGGTECSSDADCGPGLECEIEEEHGVVWSLCKPHGDDD